MSRAIPNFAKMHPKRQAHIHIPCQSESPPPPTGLDLLPWFAISSLFRQDACWFFFYKARCYISSWKAFLAMLTLIGFIFGMSHDVIFEGIFPGKTFLAMLTLTWFRLGWILQFHQATCIYKTLLGIVHTDIVSLWCEFLCVSPSYLYLQNIFL